LIEFQAHVDEMEEEGEGETELSPTEPLEEVTKGPDEG